MVVSKSSQIRDQRGATLVEYVLTTSLIALVCVFSLTLLGKNTATGYTKTAAGISP